MSVTTLVSHLIASKTPNYMVLLEEEKSCLHSFMTITRPLETVFASQLTAKGGKAGLSHYLTFSFSHPFLSTSPALTPRCILLFLIFLEKPVLVWKSTNCLSPLKEIAYCGGCTSCTLIFLLPFFLSTELNCISQTPLHLLWPCDWVLTNEITRATFSPFLLL